MRLTFIGLLTLAFLVVMAEGQSEVPKKPVYLYLNARITDHVNLGITEDRIRRVLATVDKYRQAHPEAHIAATVLFSGAVSDALERRNSQTHIVDFVKDYIARGVIEAGYDGTDEPTYTTRATVDFTSPLDPQARSLLRKAEEQKFLTEGRDPLTGALNPGKAGGLKRMQEVFGEANCITGIYALMRVGPGSGVYRASTKARVIDQGPKSIILPPGLMPEVSGDSEAVAIIRNLNSKAIMFGMPDTQPANIPGFRDGRAGFSHLISPIPDTPPELYWQDNVLRSSEASSEVLRLVHASDGAEPFQKLLAKVDRKQVHIIHVELGEERIYLQPAFVASPDFPVLQHAYEHPESPEVPASALLPKKDVDAAYAQEDALLQMLTEKFLPAEAGSGFVSSMDLTRMAQRPTGFNISVDALKTSLADFLKQWGTDTFAPPLFEVAGHFLSRAELFQVTADALAEFHRTGKFPQSVQVVPMYGPVRLLTGHGPNVGDVSVAALATICADISAKLHDQTASPVPNNSVPIGIPIEGVMLNPAQFLRLMASAMVNPSPEAKINIRMTYEFMGLGQLIPRTRPDMDDGFIWTLKPALIASAAAQPAHP